MLSETPEIRRAEPADHTELLRMLAVDDPRLATQLDTWTAREQLAITDAIIVAQGRERAGVAAAPKRTVWVEGTAQAFGILCLLYVATGMRGLRLGSRMLDALLETHRSGEARGMLARVPVSAPEWTVGMLERRGFAPLFRSVSLAIPPKLGSLGGASHREIGQDERERHWRQWVQGVFPADARTPTPRDANWRLVELPSGQRLVMRYREGVLYDPLLLDDMDLRKAAVAAVGVYLDLHPEEAKLLWSTAEGSPWADALGPHASAAPVTGAHTYVVGFDRVVDASGRVPEAHGIPLL